jgi:hypothetical protein
MLDAGYWMLVEDPVLTGMINFQSIIPSILIDPFYVPFQPIEQKGQFAGLPAKSPIPYSSLLAFKSSIQRPASSICLNQLRRYIET